MTTLRAPLPKTPDLADLTRFATLAANGHNTQPWQFLPVLGGLRILPDPHRCTPIIDPDDHHLWASLGCALENLSLAAAARGMGGETALVTEAAHGRTDARSGDAQRAV